MPEFAVSHRKAFGKVEFSEGFDILFGTGLVHMNFYDYKIADK